MFKALSSLLLILVAVAASTPYLTSKQDSVSACINAEIALLPVLEKLNQGTQNTDLQQFLTDFGQFHFAIQKINTLCKMSFSPVTLKFDAGNTCNDIHSRLKIKITQVSKTKNIKEMIRSLLGLASYKDQLYQLCRGLLVVGGKVGTSVTHTQTPTTCDLNSGKLMLTINNLFMSVKSKNANSLSSSLKDMDNWTRTLLKNCGVDLPMAQKMLIATNTKANCDADFDALVDTVNNVMPNPNDRGLFEFSMLQILMLTNRMGSNCKFAPKFEQTFGIRHLEAEFVEFSDNGYEFVSDSDQN
jgi:hypothetical protein